MKFRILLVTGAKTGTSSDTTINWRLVVVQGKQRFSWRDERFAMSVSRPASPPITGISCPGGYVVDVAGENLPSLTTNGGGCVACNVRKGI